MKRLPNHRSQPGADWHKSRLQRWLAEWVTDRRLCVEPAEADGSMSRLRGAWVPWQESVTPADGGDLIAGQVRLLQPGVVPAADRPVYLAVLQTLGMDRWLVVPFGRFAEPAVPGEWQTGRPVPPLRVLSVWNARCVPARRLRESWLVDQLSEHELADALAVWEHVQHDRPLPAELAGAVGPPLIHPLDPRWDYLEKEAALLATVMEADDGNVTRYPTGAPRDREELALAAETRGRYQIDPIWQIEGSPFRLRLTSTAEGTTKACQVIDAQGRLVTDLDGSVIRRANGSVSPPIAQGQVGVPADWVGDDTVLVCADSGSHRLIRL